MRRKLRKLVVLLVILCTASAHRDLSTNKQNKSDVEDIIDDLNEGLPVNDKPHKIEEERMPSTTHQLNKDATLSWMWSSHVAPDGVVNSLQNEHSITTRSFRENTSGDSFPSPEVGTIKVVTKCKDKPHKRGYKLKRLVHKSRNTSSVRDTSIKDVEIFATEKKLTGDMDHKEKEREECINKIRPLFDKQKMTSGEFGKMQDSTVVITDRIIENETTSDFQKHLAAFITATDLINCSSSGVYSTAEKAENIMVSNSARPVISALHGERKTKSKVNATSTNKRPAISTFHGERGTKSRVNSVVLVEVDGTASTIKRPRVSTLHGEKRTKSRLNDVVHGTASTITKPVISKLLGERRTNSEVYTAALANDDAESTSTRLVISTLHGEGRKTSRVNSAVLAQVDDTASTITRPVVGKLHGERRTNSKVYTAALANDDAESTSTRLVISTLHGQGRKTSRVNSAVLAQVDDTESTITRPVIGKLHGGRRTNSEVNTAALANDDAESTSTRLVISTAYDERRTKSQLNTAVTGNNKYHQRTRNHHELHTNEFGWEWSGDLVRYECPNATTRRRNVTGVPSTDRTSDNEEAQLYKQKHRRPSVCNKTFTDQQNTRATTARNDDKGQFTLTGCTTSTKKLNNKITTPLDRYDSRVKSSLKTKQWTSNHFTTPLFPAVNNEPEQYDSEGEYAILNDDETTTKRNASTNDNHKRPGTLRKPSANKWSKLYTTKDQYDYVINYDDLNLSPQRGSQQDPGGERNSEIDVEGILQAIISTREKLLKSNKDKKNNTSRSHKTASHLAEAALVNQL